MPGGVSYPQVIMAIKTWMGNHKTTPSPSSQIDGKDAVRKSGGMDYLRAAISDGISMAVSAGLSFTTGGTEGVGKYLDSLPPTVKEPILALKDSVGKMTSGISFPDGIESSFKSFSTTFINPISESIQEFKTGFSLSASNLDTLSSTYSQSDAAISASLSSYSTKFGTVVGQALDNAKAWSDSLTLGTGDYTLTNAFSDVNDSSAKFLENYVGITEAPKLTDLVGIIAKEELITRLDTAVSLEKEARDKDLTDPENFAAWEIAAEEVVQAAEAFQTEVDNNQAAINSLVYQQTVLDSIGQVANTHSQLTDPDQIALYESVLHPNVKDTTRQFSTLMKPSSQTASLDGIQTES